tara:strand:+ start:1014 stop:1445 length:432 start_codon:yes stop_codon:yes gene_type:complete
MINVDVNKIRREFINKIDDSFIVDVCERFSKIKSIVGLEENVEVVISKYINGLLEKKKINNQISQLYNQIRRIDEFVKNLEVGKVNQMRKEGKLKSYLNLLSDKEIDTLMELQLIKGEEGSEIKLNRFKVKRDDNVKKYSIVE